MAERVDCKTGEMYRWRVGGEKELMVEGGEQEEEQAGGEKAS
jgi:hypothetical protein